MKRIDCHGTEQGYRKSFQTNGTARAKGTEDIAVIYHYYTKSFEEFRNKRLRGDASKVARGMMYHNSSGEKLIIEQFYKFNAVMNDVYDPAAMLYYRNKSVEMPDFPPKDVFESVV